MQKIVLIMNGILVQTNSLQHEHEQLIYRQDQRNHIACKELMSNVHF